MKPLLVLLGLSLIGSMSSFNVLADSPSEDLTIQAPQKERSQEVNIRTDNVPNALDYCCLSGSTCTIDVACCGGFLKNSDGSCP